MGGGERRPGPLCPARVSRPVSRSIASALAARYARKGVQTFEIWNEPNNAIYWQPAPNPVAYTADLIAAYKAIKKVDSSSLVLIWWACPGD